ncbi:RICIN domain-containing protein [Streptomyces sp. NPDC018972]|uniref:RICIN domain-containing protein n=1 Tax=Streptomyces sp. NPDC018972 TaxID=3365060 RepID=UPI0037AA1AF0
MSRQNGPGGGEPARPAGTDDGPPVRRAVVLSSMGDDVEQAVLRPAPRRGTATTSDTATAAATATAEDTARTGETGETGRGETETLPTATATAESESGTTSAANEPEAREEAAEPGADRGEQPETVAGATTPARTASPGGTAAPLSGLAAALGGARRSGGAGRGSGDGDGDGDGDGALGRPKAPLLAAAGIAGVILLAVPLLIMVGDDRDDRPGDHATAAADSRALLDGQEAQQPPGVYAAEPSKDDAPAGSSRGEEGDDEKDGKKTEDGKKEVKDDGKASPDDSGSHPRSDSAADASPQAAAQRQKEEDTTKESAQRTESKADGTVTVASARIVNADTGKCLTASSRGAGAELVIQPCGASEGAQIWSFHDKDRTLRIGEDLCMGLDGGSVAKGTAIRLQRCDGSSGQKFKINATEDLVSLKAGDKCADVWWGKEANGTPVKLWPCTGTANQTWRRG